MKKLSAILLCLALVFTLAACGGGSAPANTGSSAPANTGGSEPANTGGDEVFTVSIQFSFPDWQASTTLDLLDKITEESNGRLKFETYFSFSLFGPPDVVGALQDGNLDMAGFMTSEYPGLFPLNGLLMGLPFLGFPDIVAATEIYQELYKTNEAVKKEIADAGIVHYVGWVLPPYNLHLVKEGASTEPDFTGLTLMTENSFMQKFINQNGGAAILSFPPDFFSNLNNGVAEGLVNHVNVMNSFGCIELIKSSIIMGDGGIYFYPLNYGFSQQFWNSLPSDLQAIFLKYADAIGQAALDLDVHDMEENYQKLLDNGTKITHLDEAQVARWREAFEPVRVEAMAELNAANPAAEDVYQVILDMIANYK